MIAVLLCLAIFVTTFALARRSLGAGLIAVVTVGYAYGIVRVRVGSVASHFLFDAALLALYAARFSIEPSHELRQRSETVRLWTIVLVTWPVICLVYSPFIMETQPIVVQLVGLRAVALMLPCIILGARMQRQDLDRLATALAVLNCLTLAFSGLEYVYGVETFIPRSDVSELVYLSRDITSGVEVFYRIPSTFVDSHVYGATMLMSLPILTHGLEATRRIRILCWVGIAAGAIGVFLCGARTPVVILAIATVYVLVSLRMRVTMLIAFGICAVGLYYLVTHFERLQRFETLNDTDYIRDRVGGSLNSSFIEALFSYPMGAGLASAFGTSIPYFLATVANPQIGIENEYGHILLEQGIPGLVLWLGFVIFCVARKTTSSVASPTAMRYMHAIIAIEWVVTGPLGVGLLTSIPSSAMMLLLMGLRVASTVKARAPLALRHVGRTGRAVRKPPTARIPVGAREASSS